MRKVDPEKHEKKRQAILLAAERCFIRDGFRGASISDICREADISPGHLYHYFASKEAIIGAMTRAGLAYAAERFSHMKEHPDTVAGLVEEIGRAKPGHDRASQVLVLDMLTEAGRNTVVADILREHTQGLRRLLGDLLRQGQVRGQIDSTLDTEVAATILICVADGAKAMSIRQPELDVTRATELLQALVSRFLTPPK